MPEDAHTSRGRVAKPKRTRVNFSNQQLETMDKVFSQTQYPDVTVLEALAKRMDLGIEKVCTWFQNRRSKFRRESKKGHIDWMRQQLFTGSSGGADPDRGAGEPAVVSHARRTSPEHVLSDVQTVANANTSGSTNSSASDVDEASEDNRVSPQRIDCVSSFPQTSTRPDCFSKNDFVPITITPPYQPFTTGYPTYNTYTSPPVTTTSANAPSRTTYHGDYTNAPYMADASWSCGQYSAQPQHYPDYSSCVQASSMAGAMPSYMSPSSQYDSRFYTNQPSTYQYPAL